MALRPRADPSGWTPSLSRARAAPTPLWRSGRARGEAGRLGAGRRRGRRKAVRDVAHVGIESVLVAGRGPAACAVVAACSRLDVKTVAVHSEADRNARHVRLADDAILLGPAPAAESYLAVDRIVEAARRSGARAVLPVPPALAGNARLAGAVVAAGLTWVGPSAAVLERLSAAGGSAAEAGTGAPPRRAVTVQLRSTLPPGQGGRVTGQLPRSGRHAAGGRGVEVVAVSGYDPGDRLDRWYDALLATVSAGARDTATAARAVSDVLDAVPEVGVPHDGAEACAVLERLASGSPASET